MPARKGERFLKRERETIGLIFGPSFTTFEFVQERKLRIKINPRTRTIRTAILLFFITNQREKRLNSLWR